MKYLGKKDVSKRVINKEYVDNKTAEIYTSVTDDFNDSTKIGTNNGVVVDTGLGLVRPSISSYVDNFSTKSLIDEDLTSAEIDVVSGVAKVVSSDVGYTGEAGLTTHVLTSELYSFADNVTEFRVTSDINTDLGNLTGIRSVPIQSVNPPSSFQLSYQMIDSGVVYEAYSVGGTSTTLYVYKDGVQYTYTKTAYNYTESDTLVKNVKIVSDALYLYVSYPHAVNGYSIKRIRKSNMAQEGSELVFTVDTTVQKMDMAISSDGYLFVVVAATTSTTYLAKINYMLLSSWSSSFSSTWQTIISNATTGVANTVSITPNSTKNKFGVAMFRSATTNGVYLGVITGFNGTVFTSQTQQITTTGESCNGNGTVLFSDGYFVALSARSGGTGLNYQIFDSGTSALNLVLNNFTTAEPFGTSAISTRFIDAEAESLSKIHLFFANTARTNMTYAVISLFGNTFSNVLSIKNMFNSFTETVIQPKIIVNQTSPFLFKLYYKNSYFEYTNNIKPNCSVSLRNNSNQLISSVENITTASNTKILSVSATNGCRVRFEMTYPIYKVFVSGTVYSAELNGYTLEQVTPTPAGSLTESSFISTPLVTDRIVRSVTLDVTQSLGSAVGNNIVWQVASLGDNWININETTTPAWTVEFPEGQYGSQLRVKATLTKAAGATTIDAVPKIEKYIANVKNVVTVSDIYPLQINLMKLALQVNTLTTANRLGYKNMMIDVFQSDVGVEPYSPLEYVGNTLFGNGSGTEQILTSKPEPTDITNVTSIVVIGDPSDISQGVTYQVRRGNGDTWVTVVPEQVYTFSSGTPTDSVQIRAIVPAGAAVRGWAYLYA